MATDEAHAHRLAVEHVMLCKGGLGLRLVEALWLLEHVPGVEGVLFRHSDQVCDRAQVTGNWIRWEWNVAS